MTPAHNHPARSVHHSAPSKGLGALKQRANEQQGDHSRKPLRAPMLNQAGPVPVETAQHHGEQTPSGGVIERARTKSDCPHCGAGQLLEVNMRASIGNAVMHMDAPRKAWLPSAKSFSGKLGVMKNTPG